MSSDTDESAPHHAALVLIDFINPLDFDGAEELRGSADRAASATLKLRKAADALHMPTIYVNDNHGRWRAERSQIVEHCLRDRCPGRDLVRRMRPRERDYFVVKPHLSGFYGTSLPILLPRLGVSRLVLTGLAADICVLFTAADAHMRSYDLWVPADAVASEADEHAQWALDIMQKSMDAETRPTS
jgi:nicotinamidase-related amidase